MNFRVLDWDSKFFGVHVAQITVDHSTTPAALADCIKKCDTNVIYVFVPSAVADRFRAVLTNFSGICYDRKVTFEKAETPNPARDDDSIVETAVETEALLKLAYASGHLSRFFLDPRFRPHFQPMYAEWIRKSLRDTDTKIFGYFAGTDMLGMVTASAHDNVGKIGLIGVDAQCRGQGIGMRLLKRCDAFYADQRTPIHKVITQKDNVAACKLYEKAGYHLADEQHVWHVWKD